MLHLIFFLFLSWNFAFSKVTYELGDSVSSLMPFENVPVSSIHIEGLRGTKIWVVTQELEIKEKELFKLTELQSSLQALERLDIFAEIKVDLLSTANGLEVWFNFKEIPLFVPHPTGEYTEENGLAIGVGAIGTNLWGRNHYIQPSIKQGFGSGGIRRFSFEYGIPRFFGTRTQTWLWLADERRENQLEGFKETYQVARLMLYQNLMYRPDYRVEARWQWWNEWVSADQDSVLLSSPLCPCKNKRDFLPALGLSLLFDSRDVSGNAHLGWYTEVGALWTGGALGGPANYPTYTLDIRRYQPITLGNSLILGNFISIQEGKIEKDIPLYRRVWVGGANSLRGAELGSDWGLNQWLLNAEWRYVLLKPTAIPLYPTKWFIDLGLQPIIGMDFTKVWNENFSEKEWVAGWYGGLQILIPYIEMIRFELGIAPSLEAGLNFKFHLSPYSRYEMQRFRRR